MKAYVHTHTQLKCVINIFSQELVACFGESHGAAKALDSSPDK